MWKASGPNGFSSLIINHPNIRASYLAHSLLAWLCFSWSFKLLFCHKFLTWPHFSWSFKLFYFSLRILPCLSYQVFPFSLLFYREALFLLPHHLTLYVLYFPLHLGRPGHLFSLIPHASILPPILYPSLFPWALSWLRLQYHSPELVFLNPGDWHLKIWNTSKTTNISDLVCLLVICCM